MRSDAVVSDDNRRDERGGFWKPLDEVARFDVERDNARAICARGHGENDVRGVYGRGLVVEPAVELLDVLDDLTDAASVVEDGMQSGVHRYQDAVELGVDGVGADHLPHGHGLAQDVFAYRATGGATETPDTEPRVRRRIGVPWWAGRKVTIPYGLQVR